ncbi:hypothetical protein HY641_02780 [Candidatus Woesearchaeota archaeon]|nr:hypothetical protein [Candidatus Woesearchaeota archaeon]
MPSFVPLKEANQHKPQLVGHPARKLSELYQANLPVADGIVLTSRVFKEYLIASGIKERFFSLLRAKEVENVAALIAERKFPPEFEEEILNSCHHLKNKGFSVRLSSVFTEGYDARNLLEENLVESIKRAWASVFTQDRAKKLNPYNMFPAVIVQPAMHETKAGQLFTINPITNSPNKMIVEVQFPKHYFFLVNKEDFDVVNDKDFHSLESPLFIEEKNTLCKMGLRVGAYFSKPQKVQWVLGDEAYLVNSEDITPEDKYYFAKLAAKQGELKINLSKAVENAVKNTATYSKLSE